MTGPKSRLLNLDIDLQKKGRGYSTIHSARGVLRPAFQMAFVDDLIRKNPFDFQLASVVVNDSVTRESECKKGKHFAFLFSVVARGGLEEGSLLKSSKHAGSRVCPNFVFKKYSTLANVCYIRIKIKIKEIIAAIRKNFMQVIECYYWHDIIFT